MADDLEKLIDECVKHSIVDPKIKAKFQDILGVKSVDEYIANVASKNNVSVDEAKKLIANPLNKWHQKIIFILA